MKIIFCLFIFFSSNLIYASENFSKKKLICPKLLWGFDFISSNKVKVIDTDINEETNIREYYYESNNELPYINLYLIEKNIRNFAYSIHRNTLRVDIWTMTSGGNTTREIIPAGFCKDIKTDNIVEDIEDLKNKG